MHRNPPGPDRPFIERREAEARWHRELEERLGRTALESAALMRRQKEEALMRRERMAHEEHLRKRHIPYGRPRRPRRKEGGSEDVAIDPKRPRHGEGGAAAALEFDE